MKIKALMKKRIRSKKIETMTNSTYKAKWATTLKAKIEQIDKTYSDSLNEAGEFYVR